MNFHKMEQKFLKSSWTFSLPMAHVYVPSNLPNWPICKLADQSANHRLASQFANGTTNLKIFLKYCFLSVKHIHCYLTPYFYWN